MGYKLIDTKPKQHSMQDHTTMSAEDHSAHLGINQSKEDKLEEIKDMKGNINIIIPFVVMSFLYMILDIG